MVCQWRGFLLAPRNSYTDHSMRSCMIDVSPRSSFSRTLCQLLIGAILFAQMAVAAYACPNLATGDANTVAATASAESMPADCDQMAGTLGPAVSNLCSAHCHNHEQSSDHADAPALPPALFTALYWLATPALAEPQTQTSETSVLHAALPPPHAILHCCFRI